MGQLDDTQRARREYKKAEVVPSKRDGDSTNVVSHRFSRTVPSSVAEGSIWLAYIPQEPGRPAARRLKPGRSHDV